MGVMKNLSIEEQETVYEQYLEEQRNELRNEGATEVCKMIKYELESKYAASIILAKPSEARPMALREAIEIVERYL